MNNPYCCALDSSVFGDADSCSASPSCAVGSSEETPSEPDQTFVYQDKVLSGFKGFSEIRIAGDIRNKVSTDDFIGFDDEQKTIGPRTKFGYYGLFYDITSLKYVGGDEQYTVLHVWPRLEKSLSPDEPIFFYPKESPIYWFGLDLPLQSLKKNDFYLKAYDDAGNLVRYPSISQYPPVLTFFYDPNPPKVLAHRPIGGSTSHNTFDIELFVSEGKGESGIDFNKTSFLINGEPVSFNIELLNESGQDPTNDYYRIWSPVSDLDDGTYFINISAPDKATNPLDTSDSNSSWTIVVDKSLPADPVVSFDGCKKGIDFDDRWYCRSSPDFTVDFTSEPANVTLTDIVMESEPSAGEAAVCNETSYNLFHCHFTEPKTSDPSYFWADYGIFVKAFKTLDDGTKSNIAEYGPYPFTVDDQAPVFDLDFNHRIRDNFNLSISAIVSNENHPLIASVEIFGKTYYPIYSSKSGTAYNFVWAVPDFDKATQEGPANMVVSIADFAGNSKSLTIPVYVDLTPPRVSDININISNSILIGHDTFTSNANVTVTGTLLDDDVAAIWTVPGDFNDTGFEEKKFGVVHYDQKAGSCDEEPPVVSVEKHDGAVSLVCDDDSGCESSGSFYGVVPEGSCIPDTPYSKGNVINLTMPFILCYDLHDIDGNRITGARMISGSGDNTLFEQPYTNGNNPDCQGVGQGTFSVNVRLYDPSAGGVSEPRLYNNMLINQINNMTLVVQDLAGHESSRKLRIITDVAAPLKPIFTITG